MANKTYRNRFPVSKLNRKENLKKGKLPWLPRISGRKDKGISRRG